MEADARVERFVRDVLGCTCPDEVFECVETSRQTILGSGAAITRTILGGRLLFYVWRIVNSPGWESELPRIVRAGVEERDSRGLNRFRLVVVADDVAPIMDRAEAVFRQVEGLDEKVHLHVVFGGDVPEELVLGAESDSIGNRPDPFVVAPPPAFTVRRSPVA
jgi:hypothetical protein